MTPKTIAALAGLFFSLAMAFIPGLKKWYAERDSVQKAGIMVLMCAAAVVGLWIYQWSHGAVVGADATIDLFIRAISANQVMYMLIRKVIAGLAVRHAEQNHWGAFSQ